MKGIKYRLLMYLIAAIAAVITIIIWYIQISWIISVTSHVYK